AVHEGRRRETWNGARRLSSGESPSLYNARDLKLRPQNCSALDSVNRNRKWAFITSKKNRVAVFLTGIGLAWNRKSRIVLKPFPGKRVESYSPFSPAHPQPPCWAPSRFQTTVVGAEATRHHRLLPATATREPTTNSSKKSRKRRSFFSGSRRILTRAR